MQLRRQSDCEAALNITPEIMATCLELATADELIAALRQRPLNWVFAGVDNYAPSIQMNRWERIAFAPGLGLNAADLIAQWLRASLKELEQRLMAGEKIPFVEGSPFDPSLESYGWHGMFMPPATEG